MAASRQDIRQGSQGVPLRLQFVGWIQQCNHLSAE
jgi:hypothetical protein